MRKRYMALVIVLAMIFGMMIPVQAEDASSDVRHSVAVVSVFYKLKNGGTEICTGNGTGFFVGISGENPEYLVTNHHVIEGYLQAGSGEMTQVFQESDGTLSGKETKNSVGKVDLRAIIRVYFNSTEYTEAYVIDHDEKKDLALLRLEAPTDQRMSLKICEPEDSMVGDTVRAIGYPGISDNDAFESTSKWDERDASITTGTISRLLMTTGKGVRAIQTDAVIQHGNSGGPMVNADNAVVGVNSWYLTTGEVELTPFGTMTTDLDKVYYALDIREVTPMLKMHDVEYEIYSDQKSGTASGNHAIYLVIIAAAAIIIICIAVILLFRKKKGLDTDKKGYGRDKAGNNESLSKTPVVRSLSPQHNGMCMSLKNRQIVIGRDPSICTIVYQDGTAGVSGKHCSLTWDEVSGEFVLTDLNSTYGTFLNTGKQLDAGIPYRLKAGDGFYLGDNRNAFRVEMEL